MSVFKGINGLATAAAALVALAASSSLSEEPVTGGQDAANLLISFVYFSNDAQSAGTYSFVEIYNPNGENVTLDKKYALHYTTGGSEWLKLDLEGTIPAKRSFLVNLGATSASPVSFAQADYKVGRLDLAGKFDQNFETAYGKVQNSGTAALTANQNALTAEKISNKDYLDLVGIGASAICEGACLTGQTKNTGYARKKTAGGGYTDSDDNSRDFLAADFSTLNLNSLCVPRNSGDYPLTLTETFTCPDFAESFETVGLQPGSDATGVNFNWYSSDAAGNRASFVRILSSAGKKDTKGEYGTAPATTANRFYHRVGITGLQQGAEYKYQLSNDSVNWGPVYGYKTTPKGSFKFAAISDVQLSTGTGSIANWKTVAKKLDDAGVNVIVHTGDQVEGTNANSVSVLATQYSNFFSPPELRSIPVAPLMGNHDAQCEFVYRYNLPNEQIWPVPCTGGDAGNGLRSWGGANDGRFNAGNYYYLYNNVLFIGLNTAYYPNSKTDAASYVNKFNDVIKTAKAKYNGKYDFIVVFHHKSTQSIASHAAEQDVQFFVEAGLEKLMTEHSVSLVFAGHDHINVRSKFLVWDDNLKKSVPNEETPHGYGNFKGDNTGTVYLTLSTASAVKTYAPFTTAGGSSTRFPYLADGTVGVSNLKLATADNKDKWPLGMETYKYTQQPEYTIVEVDSSVMKLKTYTMDGNLIDSFTITTANIPKNQGAEPVFPPIGPFSAAYEERLTLADIILPSGYKWENPETLIFAGDVQTFFASHTNSKYKLPSTGNITVNVARKSVAPPTANTGLVYTGGVLTGVNNGTGYTLNENTATNAGDYIAVAMPLANYQWSSGDNAVSGRSIPWSIARKSVVPPTANTGLVYTGSVLTGVNDGMGYTLNENTAVNAGDYIAVAMPLANHQWSSGGNVTSGRSIPWSIAKADPAVTWPDGLMAKTGQALAGLSLESYTNGGNPAGTFSWANPGNTVGAMGKQLCRMTFTPEDSVDYNARSEDVVVIIAATTAISSPGTARPAVKPNEEAAVIAPVNQLTGEFTAGPNPVAKQAGVVNFFRQGRRAANSELRIYDATGNVVNKVNISDNKTVGSQARRIVGSWDLKDAKGRQVPEGTYLVKGVLKTSDGKSEKVSVVLGVR